MEPEDLTVIGHTGDLLVDIYARNLTHIYILPQCSTTAARVLNPAGMDAQFERLRCAISCGILIISCAFNMDTACVELRFTDGSICSIDCTAVENEAADNGACCLTASQAVLKRNCPKC